MENFAMSMLWFWVCYILVTLVGIGHTIFNIYVLGMGVMNEHDMGEGYEKTKSGIRCTTSSCLRFSVGFI